MSSPNAFACLRAGQRIADSRLKSCGNDTDLTSSKLDFGSSLGGFVSLEVGLASKARHSCHHIIGKAADQRIEVLRSIIETFSFHRDSVLSALQLALKRQEILIGF